MCSGPLARSTEDLALRLKVVTDESHFEGEHDPYTKIFPFDDKAYLSGASSKLKIGFFKSLPEVECPPASKRAIDEVMVMLKEGGHEVVEVAIPHSDEIVGEFVVEGSAAGSQGVREMLEGEKEIPECTEDLDFA